MSTVKATTTIKHDGVVYNEGDELDVSEEQAARLAASGSIETDEKPVAKKEAITVDYTNLRGQALLKIAISRGVAGASKLGADDLIKILTDQDKEE